MTPVEIMALILALIACVKIIVLLFNPKAFTGVPKKFFKKPAVTMVVALILAIVALYYLLTELTIVQIFASSFFVMMMVLMTYAAFPKVVMSMTDKIFKENILKKAWLPVAIWIVIVAWVLYALFI
ncbi:hypothetical protein ACFLYT_00955 [Nanoarchaeota archaeon]